MKLLAFLKNESGLYKAYQDGPHDIRMVLPDGGIRYTSIWSADPKASLLSAFERNVGESFNSNNVVVVASIG